LPELLIINGWTLFSHPLFTDQVKTLVTKVEKLKAKYSKNYKKRNASKLLAAINKLVFKLIPQDPAHEQYRQGKTLGEEYKHWFRAKFFQQYRLFFRFDSASKIIVYAWVNDDKTLRAYDSKTDAYKIFTKMLDNGNPPDDWNALLKVAKKGKSI